MTYLPRAWMFSLYILAGLAGCESGPTTYELANDSTVLAFGDSLTQGVGATAEENYPAYLARLTGIQIINAGISGETSVRGVPRLTGALARHQPDLVILCHGGNDVLRNLSMGDLKNNLRAMIQSIHETKAKVLLVAVPSRSLTLSPHPLYEDLAQEFGLAWEPGILAELMRQPAMKSDSVHLNSKGYRRLAETLAGYIRIRSS